MEVAEQAVAEATNASIEENRDSDRWRRRLIWVLRITVFLQAVGNWWAMTALNTSPLFELLWLPADAGGLEWLEADAVRLQNIVGWAALACGALTLVRPCLLFTGPLFVLQIVVTIAMWRGDMGYPLAGFWPSPEVKRLFPFVTQTLRMAAPLALIILDPWFPRRAAGRIREALGANVLRIATAATFCAHGIEAGQHNSQFIDLLIDSARRLAGWELSESTAESILTTVALQDLALAGLCMVCRSRAIMLWMAAWGLFTAISRMIANGLDSGWYDAIDRAPHFGGPLAVAIVWHIWRERAQLE